MNKILCKVYVIVALPAVAQASTNSWTILRTLDGQSLTNATVSSVTPAYCNVLFDGGGAKIYFTNLDAQTRSEFHFDAAKADQFLRNEALKKSAALTRIQEQQADGLKAENALGPEQVIQLTAHLQYFNFQTDDGETVTILNLPQSVTEFLDSHARLKSNVEALKAKTRAARDTANRAQAVASAVILDDGYEYAKANAGFKSADATLLEERQNDASRALSNMDRQEKNKTTILARATGKIVGGVRIWQYTGLLANTRQQTSNLTRSQ